MSERRELRSRREERMENGVKNLMGSEAVPKTFLFSFTFRIYFINIRKKISIILKNM